MDDSSAHPPTKWLAQVLPRLAARAAILAALAGLVAAFVLLGGLRVDLAIIGYLVLAVFLAVLPPSAVATSSPLVGEAPSAGKASGPELTAFVEALGDPCLVLDRRGAVVHRNGSAARQYPNLAPGRVATLAMRNPQFIAAIDGVMRTGVSRNFELHETIPSETWDRVVVAPLRHPGRDWLDDDARQLLVTFQSLTELKRVDALRSDFIANASHELRTPLASLLGFIDTLLGPAARDAAAREKFLAIMRGQAERMSRLIDDMLSLSRIEMHQHVRPTGSVDLAALLREVREGLQTQASAAHLEVVLDVPADPVIVTGDRSQLYEVFENLVENALKYGSGGGSVEIALRTVDRQPFRHHVSVVDHGPGVDPEHVPRMTERFYRIDAEASRKKKGTGLGLAIVKHIVQRHRGQLSIRSKANPGEGLRVEILLP